MSLPVFLGPVTAARVGEEVVVSGDEARHAVVVRRTVVGERVVLTDGRGCAVTGTVSATSKSAMTVLADAVTHADRPSPEFTVVQAIPKGDRGELAVEMLTEIGVDRIVPWAAARCVGVWRGERAERSLAKWRAAAREAGKQSRRSWFPEVEAMATTAQVASLVGEADLAVVLHEAATSPLAALDLSTVRSVVVVVGPEGGITDEELELLSAAYVVRMGESVLRTSTAGVAAVAALMARTPRWA
ncbi:MAG: 16S rRNA (uracil(1498)-N(3))-methyltransferase [Marmoricola sp.]